MKEISVLRYMHDVPEQYRKYLQYKIYIFKRFFFLRGEENFGVDNIKTRALNLCRL